MDAFFKGANDSVCEEEGAELKYKGISVKKRPGCLTWYARFTRNGKTTIISGKTQKETFLKLKKALDNVGLLTYSDFTFATWYEKFFVTFKKDNVTFSTEREYKLMYSYLSKKFLNKKLTAISSMDIKQELDSITAPRQKQKTWEWLKGIFSKAVKQNLVKFNPVEEIAKPKYVRHSGHALTRAEVEKLIEICKNNNDWLIYVICVLEGLRKGEARALRVGSVDLEKNVINITESLSQYNLDNRTKNEQSRRTTPIFSKARPYFEKLLVGKTDVNEFLFKAERNKIDKDYKKVLKLAGLPLNYTIKDLRHTFISHCAELGIPQYVVQNWVGHSEGSRVTRNVYTHLTEDANKKFTDILDKN